MSTLFSNLTVLSLEQALTAPYLTYRFVLDGMRVIRIEHPELGDPNRFVGDNVLGERGMCTYYLPYNVGKKAITLNLGLPEGRELLKELISKLKVDVFVTNQLPSRYVKLGIDYETLRSVKPDIIWVGISGYGPENPEPAYDPTLQARSGLMEITGDPGGDPMVIGVPLSDLGAAEHAYSEVMKALYKRALTGEGSRIDVSMFQSSVSWLITKLPHVKSFGKRISRTGNVHEFFAPVNVYPTKDGRYVYVAIGNDRQWEALTKLPGFETLARKEYRTNAGRIADVKNLNVKMVAITRTKTLNELISMFNSAGIPVAKINTLEEVCEDPLIRDLMIRSEDPKTKVKLYLPPPPVVSPYLKSVGFKLSFPPRMGEHNEEIYVNLLGISKEKFEELKSKGVI